LASMGRRLDIWEQYIGMGVVVVIHTVRDQRTKTRDERTKKKEQRCIHAPAPG